MAADGYVLSELDVATLREMLGEFRNRRQSNSAPTPEAQDAWPPTVYVAKTPSGGIAGLSGTADGAPSSAVCPVYQLASVSGVQELLPMTGFDQTVFNLGSTAVAGLSWVYLLRDGYGAWWVDAPFSGGGGVPWSFQNTQNSGSYPNFVHATTNSVYADGTNGLYVISSSYDGPGTTLFGVLEAQSTVYPDGSGAQVVYPGTVTGNTQQWSGTKSFLGQVKVLDGLTFNNYIAGVISGGGVLSVISRPAGFSSSTAYVAKYGNILHDATNNAVGFNTTTLWVNDSTNGWVQCYGVGLYTNIGGWRARISEGFVTDLALSGIGNPEPVLIGTATAVSTSDVATLSGLPTIDGVTLSSGQVAMLTAQGVGHPATNGAWTVGSGAWTRPSWYTTAASISIAQVLAVLITAGNTYAGGLTLSTASVSIQVVDTDSVAWSVQPIASGNITGGVTPVGTTLTSAHIWVGNGSNVAASVAASGDLTLSNAGAFTLATVNSNVGTWNTVTVNAKGLVTAGSNASYITGNQTITLSGDITGSGATAITTTIATNAVTYAKMQQASAATLLGNPTGSTANVSEVTLDSSLSFTGSVLGTTSGAIGGRPILFVTNTPITNNTNVFAPATGFVFTPATSGTYLAVYDLTLGDITGPTANAAAGTEFEITGPASPTSVLIKADGNTNLVTAYSFVNVPGFATLLNVKFCLGIIGTVRIVMTLVNGSTSSAATLQFRSGNNGQTSRLTGALTVLRVG